MDLLHCTYRKEVALEAPEQLSEQQVDKLDDSSMKSAQGCRDSVQLLSSIPTNLLPTFRTVLKAVKLWSDGSYELFPPPPNPFLKLEC